MKKKSNAKIIKRSGFVSHVRRRRLAERRRELKKKKNISCKEYVQKRLPNAVCRRRDNGWEIVDGERVLDFARASWMAWYYTWYRLSHCTPAKTHGDGNAVA